MPTNPDTRSDDQINSPPPAPNLTAPASAIGALPRLHSHRAVAEIFGRSERTVRRWVSVGYLNTVRVGGARFVSETEILRLIEGGTAEDKGFESTPDSSRAWQNDADKHQQNE